MVYLLKTFIEHPTNDQIVDLCYKAFFICLGIYCVLMVIIFGIEVKKYMTDKGCTLNEAIVYVFTHSEDDVENDKK